MTWCEIYRVTLTPLFKMEFLFNFYRPQRNWGKVIFSQACVILFTGGCVLSQHALRQTPPWVRHPTQSDTPQTKYIPGTKYTPPGTKYTPTVRHPPQSDKPPKLSTPPGLSTPLGLSTPPGTKYTAPSEIRSMSGRYASYWNAKLANVTEWGSRRKSL